MADDPVNEKKWVNTWQKAESVLQQVKMQELQDFDFQRHGDLVDGMLQCAFDHSQPRQHSGLVEQQRWFSSIRLQTS